MSEDDDNTVQRFPASLAEDGDDPDLIPADAETGYTHEGSDEDEYNDEEILLVPVELWEMERCSCDRSANPREVPIPGERHPRCWECGKPRPRLPRQSAQATSPLDAVVAAVAQSRESLGLTRELPIAEQILRQLKLALRGARIPQVDEHGDFILRCHMCECTGANLSSFPWSKGGCRHSQNACSIVTTKLPPDEKEISTLRRLLVLHHTEVDCKPWLLQEIEAILAATDPVGTENRGCSRHLEDYEVSAGAPPPLDAVVAAVPTDDEDSQLPEPTTPSGSSQEDDQGLPLRQLISDNEAEDGSSIASLCFQKHRTATVARIEKEVQCARTTALIEEEKERCSRRQTSRWQQDRSQSRSLPPVVVSRPFQNQLQAQHRRPVSQCSNCGSTHLAPRPRIAPPGSNHPVPLDVQFDPSAPRCASCLQLWKADIARWVKDIEAAAPAAEVVQMTSRAQAASSSSSAPAYIAAPPDHQTLRERQRQAQDRR